MSGIQGAVYQNQVWIPFLGVAWLFLAILITLLSVGETMVATSHSCDEN